MKKSKNDRGFAIVFFLTLLPLILALGFALTGTGLLIQERRAALNECRSLLLEGLQKASEPMQRLLALNPQATKLQMEYEQAQWALRQALASGYPIAIAAAQARVAMVVAQQKVLDQEQLFLFHEAENTLVAFQSRAYRSFFKPHSFLKIQATSFTESRPALLPEAPGLAPRWRKSVGFKLVQTLQQPWTWSYKIAGPASSFLRSQYRHSEVCAATLNDQVTPWESQLTSVEITKDKF